MALNENIKRFRKEIRLTQRELACKSGLSFSMISKLESGEQLNPSFQTLKKIANALEINPEKLVKESIVKTAVCDKSSSDLNFRVKLQAINNFPIPKNDSPNDPMEGLYQRPEIKRLLISLRNTSKEEIEQMITLIETFQRS
ncbi:MAG: helix-turn-helix transcriptional regulator [Bacillota bacterium]